MLKQEAGTASIQAVRAHTNFFPETIPKSKQQRNRAVNILHVRVTHDRVTGCPRTAQSRFMVILLTLAEANRLAPNQHVSPEFGRQVGSPKRRGVSSAAPRSVCRKEHNFENHTLKDTHFSAV